MLLPIMIEAEFHKTFDKFLDGKIDNNSFLITKVIGLCFQLIKERDEYALLLFQPCGESHHDANACPYCKENLNGK